MEDIRFISKITSYIKKDQVTIGNSIYYNLENGNKVKMWCYSTGVTAEVINKTVGHIDQVDFPFYRYFAPVQCKPNSPIHPKWTQHIDHGKWHFEDEYPHVLSKPKDYKKLASALTAFIDMYA